MVNRTFKTKGQTPLRRIGKMPVPQLAAMLLAIAILATGCCQENPTPANSKIGYYLAAPEDIERIHQVAVLPLVGSLEHAEIAEGMTKSLVQEIQSRRLFQLDVVGKDEPVVQMINPNRREPMTLAELQAIRKELRCDAILFGSLCTFEQYPRLKIGLRLRLLDLKRGKLLWGIDHIWDTTDKCLDGRIEDYYTDKMAQGDQPMDADIIRVSPLSFQKFVGYEVAKTLFPPVQEPKCTWGRTQRTFAEACEKLGNCP